MLVILWNFPALKLCSREEEKVMISVSINKAVAMCEWQCSIDISYFHFLVVHPWITKHKRVFPFQEKIAFGRTSWQFFSEPRDLSPQSFCLLFNLPGKVISRREGAEQMNRRIAQCENNNLWTPGRARCKQVRVQVRWASRNICAHIQVGLSATVPLFLPPLRTSLSPIS